MGGYTCKIPLMLLLLATLSFAARINHAQFNDSTSRTTVERKSAQKPSNIRAEKGGVVKNNSTRGGAPLKPSGFSSSLQVALVVDNSNPSVRGHVIKSSVVSRKKGVVGETEIGGESPVLRGGAQGGDQMPAGPPGKMGRWIEGMSLGGRPTGQRTPGQSSNGGGINRNRLYQNMTAQRYGSGSGVKPDLGLGWILVSGGGGFGGGLYGGDPAPKDPPRPPQEPLLPESVTSLENKEVTSVRDEGVTELEQGEGGGKSEEKVPDSPEEVPEST